MNLHLSGMLRADSPTELDWERLVLHLPACPPRDRALIELGAQTGLRLGELLRLRIADVWRDGAVLPVLRVSRRNLKGGRGRRARSVGSRTIPLNERARAALAGFLEAEIAGHSPERPLFPSRHAAGHRPLCRQQAARIIKKIFLDAGLDPHRVWSGHSLRKRFVRRILDATGDIDLAREAVGHRWVQTTQLYVGARHDEAQSAILAIGAASLVSRAARAAGPARVGLAAAATSGEVASLPLSAGF